MFVLTDNGIFAYMDGPKFMVHAFERSGQIFANPLTGMVRGRVYNSNVEVEPVPVSTLSSGTNPTLFQQLVVVRQRPRSEVRFLRAAEDATSFSLSPRGTVEVHGSGRELKIFNLGALV